MPEINMLPPIPLYRRILRAHRRLPAEQRFLGDQFVKNEFRLHRESDNPLHIVGFLSTWQQYCEMLEQDRWKDAQLDVQKLEKMSDDQLIQVSSLTEMSGISTHF